MISTGFNFSPPSTAKHSITLPVIVGVVIFLAGTALSIKSFAQYNQYNQYETQAGTPTLSPPRHHNPPTDQPVKDQSLAYKKIDKQPEFPGGTTMLFKYIAENLKYPLKAVPMKLEGKVYVGFTVKADGSVDNVESMRGIGGGCDEEAVRIVKSMPKWAPGESRGKPVDVSMVVPVGFTPDTIMVHK
ncbi:MAG: energy transducer TonB [Bacteroidetes bacterium]|nr:energy transducer TonB [Bacteroidota bacterium]